jgi:hypothetical protein
VGEIKGADREGVREEGGKEERDKVRDRNS